MLPKNNKSSFDQLSVQQKQKNAKLPPLADKQLKLSPSAHKRVNAEGKMETRSEDTAESGQTVKVIFCKRSLGSRRSYSELC